jgi:TolB-like protein
MRTDEIATFHAMESAIRRFGEEVQSEGGRLLNFTGDGAVAAFESVAGALSCALSFQAAVSLDNSEADHHIPQFRVAVHLGEVFEASDRAYGDSLNVAARIESITPPGAVCASDLVYSALKGRSDFAFEYLGQKPVKNIPEPLEIYRVYGGHVAAPLLPARRPGIAARIRAGISSLADLERPSIAVLPLRNLSPDPAHGFFAEGVADDIITNLTRFRTIDVIARGSSFAFREGQAPLQDIGLQLGARYIAVGSIRRSADRVRVTIELSDAVTERTIWAERYDRPLDDIFGIQDEIAALSVSAISLTIEEAERQRVSAATPDSMDSYGLVLKGQSHALHYTARDNEFAKRLYQEAIKLSPRYGRAFAGLSRAHNLDWRYGWSESRERSLQRALEIAVQAVESDPNDARGYGELGYVRLYRREHQLSIAAYERALALNPNEANILAEMGDALAHAGRSEEALPYIQRAMRLNPFYPDQYLWAAADAYMRLAQFEHAINHVERMNNPRLGARILACCYAHLDRLEEARHYADVIRELQPGFDPDFWVKQVCPDRRPEDIELFLHGLKKAGL